MLTLRYMPNTSSVLHLHYTLVPLGFYTIPIFPFFYLLVSPSLFTCCQHVFIMFKSEKEG